jgi:thiamine-phosphate pyrophosphorylase
MASQRNLVDPRPSPRLCVVTPRTDDVDALLAPLVEVLDTGMVSAVLAQLAGADEQSLIHQAQALCAPVQGAGAALVINGHPDIVVRAGVDGAHIDDLTVLQPALDMLKPGSIVGAGGLKTRHDAMSAGEAGADYVMFGEADALGRTPSFDAIRERVEWWAEVFVVPCIACAATLSEVDALCAAGADFIAVQDLVFSNPQGARAVARDLKSRLEAWESAA